MQGKEIGWVRDGFVFVGLGWMGLGWFYCFIYLMYNSEEGFTFQDNKQFDQYIPSSHSRKNTRFNNPRLNNGAVASNKTNSISGTYARIVPKKPIHDLERLYSENMQLRERIRFLEEDSTKIKTRMQMAQKEREHMISYFSNNDYATSPSKDLRPSQARQDKFTKQSLDENRRILHGYKDEISKLKLENGRLKKTIKYTQIQELETENNALHNQMARMKKLMQDIIENTEYDDYEKQIERLNSELAAEKDSKKLLAYQLKKKDEEADDLKNKIKILGNRKTEIEKKFNREMGNVKIQLTKAKQRQKQHYQHSTLQQGLKSKQSNECRTCLSTKHNFQKAQQKIRQIQTQLASKQKQIQMLTTKLRESEIKYKNSNHNQNKNQKQKQKQKQHSLSPEKQKIVVEKQEAKEKKEIIEAKDKIIPDANKDGNARKKYEEYVRKTQEEYLESSDQSGMEDEYALYHKAEFNASGLQNQQQSVDQQVILKQEGKQAGQQQHKGVEEKNNTNKNSKKIQDHEQEKRKLNESDQEILFQKQEKNMKEKDKDRSKSLKEETGKGKEKLKHKNTEEKEKVKESQKERPKEKEEKISGTKAQKILKQTIKYRLIAQRYSYNDFHRDIKSSNAADFTVEELIGMLTNEPFFLTEEHLKMVLFGLFQKDQLDENDAITTGPFLKQMKTWIGDFHILGEEQEEKTLQSIQAKLKAKDLTQQMRLQQINNNQISKKAFTKILKQQGQLTQQQIQQCLAQASVVSTDIAHISYRQFLKKICQQ